MKMNRIRLGLLAGSTLALFWTIATGAAHAGPNDGPVRLARFTYVTGEVSWRRDSKVSWAAAGRNLPVRQGAQVWGANGGRSELQFDDSSRLRLDRSALCPLQTLYTG